MTLVPHITSAMTQSLYLTLFLALYLQDSSVPAPVEHHYDHFCEMLFGKVHNQQTNRIPLMVCNPIPLCASAKRQIALSEIATRANKAFL